MLKLVVNVLEVAVSMNYKEAITAIFNSKDHEEEYSILDDNKKMAKEEVHVLLRTLIEEINLGKTQDFCRIFHLFTLILRLHITDFPLLFSFLQKQERIKITGGDDAVIQDLFSRVIALSVRELDDVDKLVAIYFSTNVSDKKGTQWAKTVAFNAIRVFGSTVPVLVVEGECSVNIEQRQEVLMTFYQKVLDSFNSNCCADTLFIEHNFIRSIALDCIQSDCYDSKDLLDKLVETVIMILTSCGLGCSNSFFKEYIRFFRFIAPKIYSLSAEMSCYIRELSNKLTHEDIFYQTSMAEVGQHLFFRAVEEIKKRCKGLYVEELNISRDIDIIKIAIQLNHKFPYNNRPSPISDEDYYLELCKYMEINQLPWEKYQIAKTRYEEVRTSYQILIEKINGVEESCDELIKKSEEEFQRIKAEKNKNLNFDFREQKEKLLCEIQKRKELSALLGRSKKDFYLGYCKQSMAKNFELFRIDGKSEKEKENTLRQWVLMDIRSNATREIDKYNDVEERFKPYFNMLKNMDEIIDKAPEQTLKILRYRIKSIPFMNEIQEKYRNNAGLKFLDESSQEYKNYIQEIHSHPLYFHEMLKMRKTTEYLVKLQEVATEATEMIKENLKNSICLKRRSTIINKIIKQFENKDYDLVINMIPIQIEGLFADFLENSLIFEFRQNAGNYEQLFNNVFVVKASDVDKYSLNLGFDTLGYFKYYFSSVYRNTVAHGNYRLLFGQYSNGTDNMTEEMVTELVAHELLFDLNYLIDVIVKSNEIDSAKKYLHYTSVSLQEKTVGRVDDEESKKKLRYGRLLLDLMGESRLNFSNYHSGIFVSFEPIQILYWIFNPYFEDEVGADKVIPIRKALLSSDFWQYVSNHIEDELRFRSGDHLRKVIDKLMPILRKNKEALRYAQKIHEKIPK